jgi:hypothetical protein
MAGLRSELAALVQPGIAGSTGHLGRDQRRAGSSERLKNGMTRAGMRFEAAEDQRNRHSGAMNVLADINPMFLRGIPYAKRRVLSARHNRLSGSFPHPKVLPV